MINNELKEKFSISTDKAKLDLNVIHNFLSNSYWAKNIPLSVVQKAIENSFCFGVYEGNQQVGFARVITDRATFAYFTDVFILEDYRGIGLGKWLIETVMAHPELQGFRRFMLVTKDAQSLYREFGFQEVKMDGSFSFMEIFNPDVYQQ